MSASVRRSCARAMAFGEPARLLQDSALSSVVLIWRAMAVTISASLIISGAMVMASIDVEVTMAFSDVEVS